MIRKNAVLLIRYLISLLLVLALPAHAADIQIEEFTLSNGMPVILVPNHRVPAVNHTLWLPVGAADDPRGASGLAHYHEHLMFKGTPKNSEGTYERMVESLGGETNAFTGADYTGFYVTIATEHLEKIMALEADRFQHLAPSANDYAKEREVIIEERRSRIENQPMALIKEQINAALYQHHPYQIPIIGWMHEMQTLSAEDAKQFYDTYYHAGNMVLVVAGDIKRDELKRLAEKYYGTIPAKPDYQRNWVNEPPQRAARQVVLRHPQVKQPQWLRYYLLPSYNTPVDGQGTEHALPLALFAQWLGGGSTGLLYQKLVQEQGIAVSASAGYSGLSAGPSELVISVTPAAGVSMEALEKAVDQVIDEAVAQPIPAEDLQRIKTLFNAEAIYAREGLQSLASYVGMLKMLGLPMDFITDWEGKVNAVDAEAIQAASELLRREASVTGHLLPEEKSP